MPDFYDLLEQEIEIITKEVYEDGIKSLENYLLALQEVMIYAEERYVH